MSGVIIAAAVIGSAVYTADRQRSLAKKEAEANRRLQTEQQAAEARLADEAKKREDAAQLAQVESESAAERKKTMYGVTNKLDMQSNDLMINKNNSGASLGGTSNKQGLGF